MKTSLVLGLGVSTAAFAFAAGCSQNADETDSSSSAAAADPGQPLVISQVFAGGGEDGAALVTDYIELFNRTRQPVELGGKTLKIDGKSVALPADKRLEGGKYFTVQLKTARTPAPPPTIARALVEADMVTETAMSITSASGKVALTKGNDVLDVVAWGAATGGEGTSLDALSPTKAAIRAKAGCTDSGNNKSDFELAAPAPRNKDTAAAPVCVNAPDGGTDPGANFVLLNEIKINPPGEAKAPWQYVELLCTPKMELDGYYFAALKGDARTSDAGTAASPGVATIVIDLSGKKCGENGLALIKAQTGGHASQDPKTTVITQQGFDTGNTALPSATVSFVVVRSLDAQISVGDDFDTNDDGKLDLPQYAKLMDGVSLFEQADGSVDFTYAPRMLLTSGGATRIPGNLTPMVLEAWFAASIKGDKADGLEYDATKPNQRLPNGAVLTPGATNFKPAARPQQTDEEPAPADDDADLTPAPATGGTNTGTTPSSAKPGKPAPGSAESVCTSAPGPKSTSTGFMFAGLGLAITALLRRRRRTL